MLFIDYSSVFNTIVPSKVITKLRTLGLNTSLCNWILYFLTGHPHVVRVGNYASATLILNTGAPQGCVFRPHCRTCSLMTAPTPLSLLMTQQWYGLITDNDETAYREEVRDLTMWCKDNNLSLNVIKTKEMIVDYRKKKTEHTSILIDGTVVEQVESFKFLGVHITNKL